MKNKVFSRIDDVLDGKTSDKITDGCIVLEGGAFRGLYTEGVLDYLMTQDINMQTTIGVSAGAINGSNYVSGQIGRAARTNLRYRHNSDYVGFGAIRKNDGIIGFDFLYNELEKIDPIDKERFFDSSRKMIAVTANLITGKEEYMDRDTCSDIFQAIRASASMPFVSKPVYIDSIPYLDGGCITKIPFQWALDKGFEKIIVVRTRDDAYRSPAPKADANKVCNKFYRNYPEFAAVLARNNIMYNNQCDELERLRNEGRVFVIGPSKPVEIGRLEPDTEKLGELYFLGVEDAKKNFEALKTYLQK